MDMLALADGSMYYCTNRVRNLENGKRRRDEVIRTIPDRLPYSPQPFPRGLWTITEIERRKNGNFDRGIYGDVKIRTDAYQQVEIWELDRDGDYHKPTGQYAFDTGYLLHESPRSSTTLGCIRLPDRKGSEIAAKMTVGDELEVI
jgi:lipoprotein-anchoring transpeptidase ErfK/SrfK